MKLGGRDDPYACPKGSEVGPGTTRTDRTEEVLAEAGHEARTTASRCEELPLVDPQTARELAVVLANVLEEALRVFAKSTCVDAGKPHLCAAGR
jgi:hypothetical protein